MNMLDKNFTTKEEGMQKLKEAVSIRNQMGGALYYNILNDDCLEIAQKVKSLGGDRDEIMALLS